MNAHSALRLSDYVSGLLTADEAIAVEAHLDACPECRELAGRFRAAADWARGYPGVPPSPNGYAAIRRAIRTRRNEARRWRVPVSLAAGVLLMLAGWWSRSRIRAETDDMVSASHASAMIAGELATLDRELVHLRAATIAASDDAVAAQRLARWSSLRADLESTAPSLIRRTTFPETP